MEKSYKEYLHKITTLIFDIDGVLTDGSLHTTTEGNMHRTMNAKDGFAMKEVLNQGLNLTIISGGTDESVLSRLQTLGIKDITLGAHNKIEHLESYLSSKDIDLENVLDMGDDIPNYPVLKMVGLPCCPQDAVKEVKDVSKYISHKNGGKACVLDIIEQIFKIQGKWMTGFDASGH